MGKEKVVVILAGGKGKRLGELGEKKQKATFLLKQNLLLLDRYFDKILIIVGHRKEDIFEILKELKVENKTLTIKIKTIEQKERLGTAHAVGMAEQYIEGDFFVVNGDLLLKEKYFKKMLSKKPNVIAVSEVGDSWNYGVVLLEDGKISSLIEKPKRGEEPSKLINAGIYYFTPQIFKAIKETPLREKGEYFLTDSMMILIKKYGQVISAVEIENPKHITTAEDIKKFN